METTIKLIRYGTNPISYFIRLSVVVDLFGTTVLSLFSITENKYYELKGNKEEVFNNNEYSVNL